MAGQMEVVGGVPSCLVARHESAPTIAPRSSSMDADAYFVQPSPVLQMQMEMEPERQSQQHAQGQSSSTPWKAAQGQSIECTASANLTAQWKASTADPLFRALQTMFTAVPARGVKRSVLQDWNCADSPSLKRFRYESGTTARPPPTPIAEPATATCGHRPRPGRHRRARPITAPALATALRRSLPHAPPSRITGVERWGVGRARLGGAGAAQAARAALRRWRSQQARPPQPRRRGRAQGHAPLPAQPAARPAEQIRVRS